MGTNFAAFGIVLLGKREYPGDGQCVEHEFDMRRRTTRTRSVRDTSVPSIGKFCLPLVCGIPPTDSRVDYLIMAVPMTIGSIFCSSICPARTVIFDTPTGGIDLTCGAAASSCYESTATPTLPLSVVNFCLESLSPRPPILTATLRLSLSPHIGVVAVFVHNE